MGRRLCVDLPSEIAERLDAIVELLDFGSGEEFAYVAVRRLLDMYTMLSEKLLRTL